MLYLIEAGVDIALKETHKSEYWEGDDEGSATERRIAELLHDAKIAKIQIWRSNDKRNTTTGKLATG